MSYHRISAVAARLSLSRAHVYKLIDTRKLPSHDFDGAIRISEADLKAYETKRRIA